MIDRIDVIFFDVGGTLLENVSDCGLFDRLFNVVGGTKHQLRRIFNQTFRISDGDDDLLLSKVLNSYGLNSTDEIKDYLFHSNIAIPHLFNDVIPTFEYLHERGYTIGILSNTSRFESGAINHYGLEKFLTYKVISFEVGVQKPQLEIFRIAQQMCSVNECNLLYVGDSLCFDYCPAVASGWQALLLTRNFHMSANFCISGLSAIKGLL